MPEANDGPQLSDSERAFADEMRRLREEHGWNQRELAEQLAARSALNLDQAAISRIEKHKRVVRMSEALEIAGVFGRSVYDMVQPDGNSRWLDAAERQIQMLRVGLQDLDKRAGRIRREQEAAFDLLDRIDNTYSDAVLASLPQESARRAKRVRKELLELAGRDLEWMIRRG